MSVIISEHAKDRIKERCGLKKKAIENTTMRALLKGLSHREAHGSLKRYFDNLFFYNKNGNHIRIYGTFVYIFSKKSDGRIDLVTVLDLPRRYNRLVRKAFKEREKRTEEEIIDQEEIITA